MKTQDFLKELEDTRSYKNFKTKNPDSFFTAAFLILNLEDKTEQIQLDYFIPKENKIATFEWPIKEPKIHADIISTEKSKKIKSMQKQSAEIKINIDDLELICKDAIKENNYNLTPKKIIAILKDDSWNLTCMDNFLGIVRMKVDAITGEVKDFNKDSLMNFVGIKK